MGNIRDKSIKKICKDIYELYPTRITNDFESNKKLVKEITDANKKAINKIAGYLTVMNNKKNRLILPPKKQKKVKSKKDIVKKQFHRWI